MENKVNIGTIVTAENGEPKREVQVEALLSSSFFGWFAEEAPRITGM